LAHIDGQDAIAQHICHRGRERDDMISAQRTCQHQAGRRQGRDCHPPRLQQWMAGEPVAEVEYMAEGASTEARHQADKSPADAQDRPPLLATWRENKQYRE